MPKRRLVRRSQLVHVGVSTRSKEAVGRRSEGVSRVGILGEHGASAAGERRRGVMRAFSKGRCSIQHSLPKERMYLRACALAFGRRVRHGWRDGAQPRVQASAERWSDYQAAIRVCNSTGRKCIERQRPMTDVSSSLCAVLGAPWLWLEWKSRSNYRGMPPRITSRANPFRANCIPFLTTPSSRRHPTSSHPPYA